MITSSAVQKEASAFLYICQMSWYLMGKMTNRWGFSLSNGSSSTLGLAETLLSCRVTKKKTHHPQKCQVNHRKFSSVSHQSKYIQGLSMPPVVSCHTAC